MAWYHRIRNVFDRGGLHADVDREMAFHLKERAEQLRQAGYSPHDAERIDRRQLGNRTAQIEQAGDMQVSLTLETTVRNLRPASGTWNGVLAGMLFGISPNDPATLSGVVVLVLLATGVACWIPARFTRGPDAGAAGRISDCRETRELLKPCWIRLFFDRS